MFIGSMGQVSLFLLLVTSCTSICIHIFAMKTTHFAKLKKLGRIMMGLQFALTFISSFALVWLLITENLNYTYVADYTARGLSLSYRIAAFWAGNAGSLLLWTFVVSLYGFSVSLIKHKEADKMSPIVSTILTFIVLFFTILLNFNSNPFIRLSEPAFSGNGLSPLLQNPGMIVHPVNIYLGYIGFSVPFAYAMAALILGKTDAAWLKVTRLWTLVSWLFLSIGIVYGAHWSYEELGWGGYFAWDPVENASLLPWLTSTAFLHSAMVEERRGMFKRWNIILISLTFWLTAFGTFLTRSGVIWSIHAFSNATLGAFFMVFLLIIALLSLSLIIWRWSLFAPIRQFEGAVSKETGIALHNILLMGMTFAIAWGTLYPIISRILTGRQMMLEQSFYNSVSLPFAVAIIALMGIGPSLVWRKDTITQIVKKIAIPFVAACIGAALLSTYLFNTYHQQSVLATLAFAASLFVMISVGIDFYHLMGRVPIAQPGSFVKRTWSRFLAQRRHYGGMLVHFAIACLAIGIAGSGAYHVDLEQQLSQGQTVQLSKYQLHYEGTAVDESLQTKRLYANLVVSRNSRNIGVMQPAVTFFTNGQAPATDVSIYSTPLSDLYIVLLGTDKQDRSTFDFHINPLVEWIWFGGYLFVIGALVSLWPESNSRR